MSSVSQILIAFLSCAALAAGDGETPATAVKPTAAGYDVTQRPFGQWQSQYGAYQNPATGFRTGSSWPYNQDQYNAYGNKNWNSGQYTTYPTSVPAYGNRYSTFGTTGYPQGYGNQGIAYNPAYGNQAGVYNPYGNRYQTNPSWNRPYNNAYGSRTTNNPYNTPWLNAFSGQAPGFNNAYGAPGYRNIGYPYNAAATSIPSTIVTSTPKYNTFGSQGYSAGYNPSSFGGTGYGYNSVGFGVTGQDYNTKYSAGSKQWADGRYSGDYGSQSYAKPWYQNQYTSPTFAPTNTAYGK